MNVCPVCKAEGECPVEDGVTFHRQYPPPPPGWRPTREQVERAVERRLVEQRAPFWAEVTELWPELADTTEPATLEEIEAMHRKEDRSNER